MNNYSLSKLPKDVLLEIAERHKELRKELKWTQAEMAERSGVSLGSLKRFERTGKISLESLLSLSHTLNRLHDFDAIFASSQQSNLDHLFTK